MPDELGGKDEKQVEMQTKLDELQAKLEAAATEKEESSTEREQLEARLTEADNNLTSPDFLRFLESQQSGDEERKSANESTANLDNMTGSQLVQHLQASSKEALEKLQTAVLKKLDNTLGATRTQVGQMVGKLDIEVTKLKHSGLKAMLDGKESKAHFMKVASEHPGWDAEEVFRQTRIEERIAAEVKAEMEKEKTDAEEKIASEKGGIAPTLVDGKQPTPQEAANLAADIAGL